MNKKERKEQYLVIKKAYQHLEESLRREGKPLMRNTSKGFWGVSDPDVLYTFFEHIKLGKCRRFLDLGSGDGRMVLIASLFCDAVGIEIDEELVSISKRIAKETGQDCTFYCKDFMKEDFGGYDVMMTFYDKIFSLGFEQKMEKEFNGVFYNYDRVYLPSFLLKGKTYWIGQTPIISYTVKNK